MKGVIKIFLVLLLGVACGYWLRMAHIEPQRRQDVLSLKALSQDNQEEIRALKTRLTNAEADCGKRIAEVRKDYAKKGGKRTE